MAGGFGAGGEALAGAEYFDPGTERFSPGPALPRPRRPTSRSWWRAGRAVGGSQEAAAIGATDVLDLATGSWRPGPALITARVKLGAVATADGRVFVVGGARDTEGAALLSSTELLDLEAGSATGGPALSEGEYKLDGAVATLADGRIVVGGGTALEVYDADVSGVRRVDVPGYDARSFRTLTAVGPDTVLVLGGYDAAIVPTDEAFLVPLA